MQEDQHKTVELLNQIITFELAGVVRYTYYSLIALALKQIDYVDFFKEQASESLTHAQKVGEVLMNIDGNPNLKIPHIEVYQKSIQELLEESWKHESKALELYKLLLSTTTGKNSYIEEFAQKMISEEGIHSLELKKMLDEIQS